MRDVIRVLLRWLRWTRVFACFALMLASICATPVRAETWRASEDDQLLLELRSGSYRLGEPLRGYQTPGGTCVDFADLIQALDLPLRLDKKSRRATGWLFAEDQHFVLDRDARTVQTPAGNRALAADAIHDTPEGWCMDLGALSGWFGIDLVADLGNLAVVIKSARKLPFLDAIERRSRAARLDASGSGGFDLAMLPRAALPYRAWRAPALDVQVQSQWSRTTGFEAQYELRAAGEALGLSYAARLSGTRLGGPDALRFRAFRYAPEGTLLGPLSATQVTLGDVETPRSSLIAQGSYGRGLLLSNRPLNLPARFGVTTLRGTLPAGWDAELYRNGELRAAQGDRGDGRYDFADIELLFGQNDFDVVLYGPQGQIRHERTSMPVGGAAIPAGKTWYWAGIAQDHHDLINFTDRFVDPLTGWRWGIGVERGVDSRTSIGIEAHSIVLAGRRRNFLEATLRRSLAGVLLETAAARQFGAGRALRAEALGKIGAVRFDARALWVAGDFESELIKLQQRREYSLRLNGAVRAGSWRLPIEAGLRRTQGRDGRTIDEWSLRGSMRVAGIAVGVEWQNRGVSNHRAAISASGADDPGGTVTVLSNMGLGIIGLDGVRLRGSARFRVAQGCGGSAPRGFEQAQVVVEAPAGRGASARAGYDYDAPARRHDFTVGYTRQFDRFAVRAEGRADNRGGRGLALALAFSIGPDPVAGGWRLARDRLAQNGQAAVEVFRDENGDGTRQIGEPAVSGVTIAAGVRKADRTTDRGGRAVVDGLQPYVPVLVTVDPGSLPDPLLKPKGPGLVVVPRPGVLAQLVLPLAPTGEIEAVLLSPDGQPRGGLTVELADPAGRVVLRTVSDFDGYVLFDAVPYGDYRLQLGPTSAAALGARPGLVAHVRIDQEHASLQLGKLRPEPAPTPAQIAASTP
ncbi:MAG: hypothetical protein RIQ99_1448 [Pseudomonadota bacterium]